MMKRFFPNSRLVLVLINLPVVRFLNSWQLLKIALRYYVLLTDKLLFIVFFKLENAEFERLELADYKKTISKLTKTQVCLDY